MTRAAVDPRPLGPLSARRRRLPALDGVSLDLAAGERLAIIGESGSGKSTLALAIAGLLPATRRSAGRSPGRALATRRVSGRDIGFVFQDPGASLDPVHAGRRADRRSGAHAISASAGAAPTPWPSTCSTASACPSPTRTLRAYPHQLSGGQRQRVAIAAAIAAGPKLLIADEPTSALDTIVQAEIVALIDAAGARGRHVAALHHPRHRAGLRHRRPHRRVPARPPGRDRRRPRRSSARPRDPYTRALLASHRPRTPPLTRSAGMSAPLLDCQRPVARSFRRGGRRVAALDDVSLDARARRDAGAGRPVGQRQVDARPHRHAADRARRRPHPLRRRRSARAARRGAARRCGRASRWCSRIRSPPSTRAPPSARVLADPLRIHGLADRAERPAPIAALLERVGLDRGLAGRAHPRDFRRPAPARRHRPRHRHQAGADRARRGGLGARRLGARRDPRPAGRPAARRRHRLSLHLARPRAWSRAFAHRIAIMDRGRIVETGPAAAIVADPQSATGKALVAAMPRLVHRECRRMNDDAERAERLSRELDAAFRNRADLYRLLLDELTAELGAEAAEAIMIRTIEQRGREVAARPSPASARTMRAPSARRSSPSARTAAACIRPTSSAATTHIAFKVRRCPLKDAWVEAGVGDDKLATLCRIAGAFDRGLFEATGVRFDNVTWTPGHGSGCCHIRLTNGERPGRIACRPSAAGLSRPGDARLTSAACITNGKQAARNEGARSATLQDLAIRDQRDHAGGAALADSATPGRHVGPLASAPCPSARDRDSSTHDGAARAELVAEGKGLSGRCVVSLPAAKGG